MIKLEDKIADELGEKVIKEIGYGDFGEVFLLESGKVLKLTSDRNEITIAKKLVKNKNLFKNILNYYNVGEIDSHINLPPRHPQADYKYFILMDYINPLSKLEKAAITYAYKPLLQFSKSFYQSVFHPNFIDSILYRFNIVKIKDNLLTKIYTEEEIKQMKQIAIDFIPYVKEIAKDLKLHHIEQCDFHGGNLGWNDDHTKLILFDITTPTKYGLDVLMMLDLKLKKYPIFELKQSPDLIINSRIKEIAEELGENIDNYLSSGNYGFAFKTKSGKVLKITSDENEVNIAYKLSKYKNWMKCIVNYYNVGKIKSDNKSNRSELDISIYEWYILMDYIEPLTREEQEAIDCYQMSMHYEKNYYNNILNKEEVFDNIEFMYEDPDSYQNVIANRDSLNVEDIKKIAKDFYPKILNIAKELKKHGVKDVDFHSGNIGWDKDHENLILYDLGGSVELNTKQKFKEIFTTEKFITRFKRF
jgi:hypothetical protein